MEHRELGRTGHKSTVVTFGTAGIGRVKQDVADKAIEQYAREGRLKANYALSHDQRTWKPPEHYGFQTSETLNRLYSENSNAS